MRFLHFEVARVRRCLATGLMSELLGAKASSCGRLRDSLHFFILKANNGKREWCTDEEQIMLGDKSEF